MYKWLCFSIRNFATAVIQGILLRHVFRGKSNSIFGHDRLSGGSMRSNENRVAVF